LALLDAGHQVTIIDDLSTGYKKLIPSNAIFVECNINDALTVGALLQIDASGEAVLSELVDSCSSAGIEILFSRTERLEAELFRSGFKKRFGENRFFNRTAQALKYVWEELESEEEEKGKVINIS